MRPSWPAPSTPMVIGFGPSSAALAADPASRARPRSVRVAECVERRARCARIACSARMAAASSAALTAPAADRERSPPECRPASARSTAANPCRSAPSTATGTPSTGKRGLGGGHARQVRRAAGAGDDHLEPARFGARGVLEQQVGRAMRGDDAHLEWARRARSSISAACAHRLPVGRRAHDDADQWFHREKFSMRAAPWPDGPCISCCLERRLRRRKP